MNFSKHPRPSARNVRSAVRKNILAGSVALLTAVFLPTADVDAAPYYWDADGTATGDNPTTGVGLGGNGIWDTTTNRWWDGTNPLTTWPNSGTDTAIFAGAGGVVQINSTVPGITLQTLTFNSAGFNITGDGTAGTQTLTLASGNAINVNFAGTDTISAVIAGSNGLSMNSTTTGTLVLNGANIFTGTVTINSGTLSVYADNNLGNAANGIAFAGTAGGIVFNAPFALNAGRTTSLTNLGGVATFSASTTSQAVLGQVTGVGGLAVNNAGTTLLLSSTNNFTGVLWGQSGTLVVASLTDTGATANIKLGNAGVAGTFQWAPTAVGPLTLNVRAIELAGTTGGGTIDSSSIVAANSITISRDLAFTTVSSGAKTFTLQGVNAGINTFAGNITNNGTSATALTKGGLGLWQLTGTANNYTGALSLGQGVLLVVNSSGLGGTGTLTFTGGGGTGEGLEIRSDAAPTGVRTITNNGATSSFIFLDHAATGGNTTTGVTTTLGTVTQVNGTANILVVGDHGYGLTMGQNILNHSGTAATNNPFTVTNFLGSPGLTGYTTGANEFITIAGFTTDNTANTGGVTQNLAGWGNYTINGTISSPVAANGLALNINKNGSGILTYAPTTITGWTVGTLTLSAGTTRITAAPTTAGATITFGGGLVEMRNDASTNFTSNIGGITATSTLVVDHSLTPGTGSAQTATLGTFAANGTFSLNVVGDHGYGLTLGTTTVTGAKTVTINNYLGTPGYTGYTGGSITLGNGTTAVNTVTAGAAILTLGGFGNYAFNGAITSAGGATTLQINQSSLGVLTLNTNDSGWTAGTMNTTAGTTIIDAGANINAIGTAAIGVAGGLTVVRNNASTAWSANNLILQTASGTLVAAPQIGSSNTGNTVTLGSLTSATTGLTFSFDTNHNYGITLNSAATSAIAATTISNIGNGTVTFAGGLTNTAATVWTLAGNGDFTATGNLLAGTVTTGLTKTGFGTLTLSGAANTFTGVLTLTAGIVKITTPLGTGAGALTFNNTGSGLPNNNVIGLDLRNNSSMDLSTHPLGRSITTVFNVDNNGSGTNGTMTLGSGLSLQDNAWSDLFMGANGYSLKFAGGAATKVSAAAGGVAMTLWNYIPSISGSGNVEFNGGLAFQNTASTGGLTFAGTGDFLLSGAFSGTVADTITKSGLGTVTITADSSAGWNTSAANNIYTQTAGITRATVAGALGGANAKYNLNAGVLDLRNDTGFTLTTPVTVGANNSFINVDRAIGGVGTGQTQTLGGVSLGAFTLFTTGGNNYSLNTGTTTITTTAASILNNIGGTGTLTIPSLTGTNTAITLSGSGSTTISAATIGTGTIAKSGSGTVTLTEPAGTNTTGALTVNAGTFAVDYTSGTTNPILTAASTLTLAGGTFKVIGASTGSTTHSDAGNFALGAGGSAITITPQGSGTTTFSQNTGTFTSTTAGGTLLVTSPTNALVQFNSAMNTAITLNGRIVFTDGAGNYNWLANTGVNSTSAAYAAYTGVAGTTLATNALNDQISSVTASQVTTVSSAVATNSLMINAGAATQSLSLGNVLTLTNGGLLFTGSNNYSITGTAVGNGLKSTTADLYIHQYGAGTLTINAPILAGTNLDVTGTGVVVLGGALGSNLNTYTGTTFINGTATLRLANATRLGTGNSQALTMSGGTFDLNGNSVQIGVLNSSTGNYAATIDNSGAAATLTLNTANTAYLGAIKNTGSALGVTVAATTGTVTLGDVNSNFTQATTNLTFTGDLSVTGNSTVGLAVPLADTASTKINLGTTVAGNTPTFKYTGNTNLTLANRQFDLSNVSNAIIDGSGVIGQNGVAGVLVISSNLLTDGTGAKTLTLQGSAGALSPGGGTVSGITGSGSVVTINQFNGTIGNASGGGALTLVVTGAGGWSLGGANNFTGGVTLSSTGIVRGTVGNGATSGSFGGSGNTITWSGAGQLDLRADTSQNFGNPISWGNAALKINVDRAINGSGYGQIMTLGAITETVTGQTLTVTNAVGVGTNLNGTNPIGGYGLRIAGLVLNAGTATNITNGIGGASAAQFGVPASGTGIAGAFTIDGITTGASLGTHTLTIASAGNSVPVTIITGDIVQNTGTTVAISYTGNNLLALSGQTASTNYSGGLTISTTTGTVRATTGFSLGSGTVTIGTAALGGGTLEVRNDSGVTYTNNIVLGATTAATGKLNVGEAINGSSGRNNTFSFGTLGFQGVTANQLTVAGISGSNSTSGDSVTFSGVSLGNSSLNGTAVFTVTNNLLLPGMLNLGNVTSTNTTGATTQTLTIAGAGVTTLGNVTDSGTATALTAINYTGTGILDLTRATSGNTYTGGLTLTGGTTRVVNANGLGASTNVLNFAGGQLELRSDSNITYSNPMLLNATGTGSLNVGQTGTGTGTTTGVTFTLGQLKVGITGSKVFAINGIGLSLAASADSVTLGGVELNSIAGTFAAVTASVTNNLQLPGMVNIGNVTNSTGAGGVATVLGIAGSGVTTIGDVTNGTATSVGLTYTGTGILDLSRMTVATNYSGGFTQNGTGTTRVTNPLQFGTAGSLTLQNGNIEIRSDSAFTYSNPINWNVSNSVGINVGELGTGTTTGVGSTFSFGALTITTATGKALTVGGIGGTGANSFDNVVINGVTFGAGNLSNTISNNLSLPGTLALGAITGAASTTAVLSIGGAGFTTMGDVTNGAGGGTAGITFSGSGILQITPTATATTNYSGGLNLTGAGILRVIANATATNFGATGNTIALTNGTLDIRTDASLNVPNPITVATNTPTINVDQATSGNLSNTVTFSGAAMTLSTTAKTLTLTSGSNYGMTFTNGFSVNINAYTIANNASGTVNLGALSYNSASGALTLGGSGMTIVGAISGTSGTNLPALTYSGTGLLDLTGNNAASNQVSALTLSGAGGIVKVNNPTNLGAANDTVFFTSATANTLQVRNDNGVTSNGTIAFGNTVALNVASSLAIIDVGNNGGSSTGNTVAFGALTNNTTAQTAGTLTVNGANGYGVSFTSATLPNGTGNNTTIVANIPVTISGNVGQAITPVAAHFDTLFLDGVVGGTIQGVISDSTTGGVTVGNGDTRITKNGTGTWTLTNNNTNVGPTTVNAGTLLINGSSVAGNLYTVNGSATQGTQGTLGGTGTISGTVTLATNGATSFPLGAAINPGTVGTTGTLTVSGAVTTNNFSKLNFDLTGGLSGAVTAGGSNGDLISTGMLPVIGLTTQININALTSSLTPGAVYTLINGYSGTIANANVNTTVGVSTGADTTHTGSLTSQSGKLLLTILNPSPTGANYWLGAVDGNWNTTVNGGGTGQTNWSDSTGATDALALPGTNTDVHFIATGAGNLTTTLGQNFSIRTLSFDASSTSPVSISGNTLTITPATSSTGISLDAAAGAVTISSAITAGANQTWTNNSTTNALSIGGTVALGANTLTIAGPGQTTVTAGGFTSTVAAGSVAMTIGTGAGSGSTLNMTNANNANSFPGDFAVNGGVLIYTNGGAATQVTTTNQLGVGSGSVFRQILLTNGGTFRVSAFSFNDNIVSTTNKGAGFVFNIGSGGGTFNVDSGLTFTVDDGTTTGTGLTAAEIQGAGTLTKSGLGTLSLGTSTQNFTTAFTGNVLLQNGTIKFGAITTGAVFLSNAMTMGSTGNSTILDVSGLAATVNTLTGLTVDAGATAANQVVGNSSTTANGGLSLNITGSNVFSGVIQNTVGAGTKLTSINATGTGNLILTGTNTYTGGTNVQQGSVQLAGGDQRISTSGVVTLGNGTTTSGLLVVGGNSTGGAGSGPTDASNRHMLQLNQTAATAIFSTVGSVQLSNSVVGGANGGTSNGTPWTGTPDAVNFTNLNNSILKLNISIGFTDTYDGGIGGTGIQNNINLVKSGGGTLVLTGNLSNWTGTTTDAGPGLTDTTSDATRPEIDLTGGVLRLATTATINTVIRNTGGVIDDQGATYGNNYFLIVSGGLISFSQTTDSFSNSGLTSSSHGVGALNIPGNTGVVDFVGSDMYLGAVGARVYSNSPLAAGSGNTYRLGGGAPWNSLGTASVGGSGGNLQISTANVITGANAVIIGDNGTYNSGSGLFGGLSTVEFTAAQNFTNGLTIYGGTFQFSTASLTSGKIGAPTTTANSLLLDGGALNNGYNAILRYGASTTQDLSAQIGIVSGGTVDTGANNVTFATALANTGGGTGGLNKNGTGTLTLTAANTYVGTTTVSAGTLQLNGQTGSLNAGTGTALTFAGSSTFRFDNTGTSGTLSQTMGALSFTVGDGVILSQRTAAQSTNLTFASLSARTAGATGNFTVGGTGATAAINKVIFTAAPTASQFIDGGLYFGGTDFAVYDSTGFIRNISYGTDKDSTGAVTSVTQGAGTTIAATGADVNLTGALTAQTAVSIESLKIAGANAITFAANGNTLIITSGGIIKTGATANFGSAAANGIVQAGATGTAELDVRLSASADALVMNSAITAGSLTLSGAGTLTLATANTISGGAVTVNGGVLILAAANEYGAASGITLNGGEFRWNTAGTALPKIFTLGLNGGSINSVGAGSSTVGTAGDVLGLTGTGARTLNLTTGVGDRRTDFLFSIGDNGGPTSLNVGSLSGANSQSVVRLSGSNTYTGTTTITLGTLELNSANALPGGLGGTTPSSTNTGGGNLTFNGGTATNHAMLGLSSTSGDFMRGLGSGFDQVQFAGNGGFGNINNNTTRIVNLGGLASPGITANAITWGSSFFFPSGGQLEFGLSNTNVPEAGVVDFQNSLALGNVARIVDVQDNTQGAATSGLDAILSGNLTTSGAVGGLNKTGTGVLKLTGDNTGSNAASPTLVNGGILIFANATTATNAILGSGRTVTVASGAGVVLSGATPGGTPDFASLLSRIVTTSAGGALLDTSVLSSTANIDFSPFSALGLGAYSDQGGVPIYYNGSITPNGTTYRFSSPITVGGQGSAATAVQFLGNLLVLPNQNVLTGSNAASLSTGFFYLQSSNNFTGGSSLGNSFTNVGIGSDSAFGTGLITFADGRVGALNGDHTLSNNIKTTGTTGNMSLGGNLANEGVDNAGGMTYLGTVDLSTLTSGGVFTRSAALPAIFLGDIKTSTTNNLSLVVQSSLEFLTTPAGAVASKTLSSATAGTRGVLYASNPSGVLTIDSAASLGAAPSSNAAGYISLNGVTNATLQVLPGITSAISLSANEGLTYSSGALFYYAVNGSPTIKDSTGASTTGLIGNSALTFNGVMGGSSNNGATPLNKLGYGTLTLTGKNTVNFSNAAAAFAISAGTVVFDFANSAATDPIFTNPANPLPLNLGTAGAGFGATQVTAGVTLSLLGKNGQTNSQIFGPVTNQAKDNNLTINSNGGTVNVTLGTITNTLGGTLAVTLASSGTLVTSATTATLASGAAVTGTGAGMIADANLNPYVIVGGNEWGAKDASNNVVAGAGIAGFYTANTATAFTANTNADLTTAATLAAASTTVNSLRLNTASALTLSLGSAANVLITGGILMGTGTTTNNQVISVGILEGTNTHNLAIYQANTAATLTISAAINDNTGATALSKAGPGTLVLSGTNNFTGVLYLNGGTLSVNTVTAGGTAGTLGKGTNVATNLVFNGGTVRYTGTTGTTDRGATFNAISAIDVTTAGQTLTLQNSSIAITGLANTPGILRKIGAGTLALGGTTAANANLSVEVAAGVLNLAKTSTGNTLQQTNGAALIVDSGATAKVTGTSTTQIAADSSVLVNSGGQFDLNAVSQTFDGLAGGGTVTSATGTPNLTLGSNNDAAISAYTVAATAAGLTGTGLNNFSGSITGTIGLAKLGAGTQIISSAAGNNTYSGGTTITSGTLRIGATNALPTSTDVTIAGNTVINALIVPGILDLGGFNLGIDGLSSSTGGTVTNSPTLVGTAPGVWNASGLTTSGSVTRTLTIGNNNQSTATFNGIMQDGFTVIPVAGSGAGAGVTGILALTKSGTGVQSLTGANTASGILTVNQGEVDLNTTGSNAWSGNVTVNQTGGTGTLKLLQSNQIVDTATLTVSGGTLDLNGKNETVGGVSLTTNGSIINTGGGSNALTSTTTYNLQSGSISAVLAGTVGATVTSGTVTFSGANANTYSGLTTITSGELDLNKTAGVNAIVGDGANSKSTVDILVNGGTLKWLVNNQLDDTVYLNLTSGTVNLNNKTDTIYEFNNSGGTFLTGRTGNLTITDPTWSGNSVNEIANTTTISTTLFISGGTNTGGINRVHGDESSGFGSAVLAVSGLEFTGTSSPDLILSSDNTAPGVLKLNGDVTFSGASGAATISSGNALVDRSGGAGTGPWTDTGIQGSLSGRVDLNGANRTFTVSNSAGTLAISAPITNSNGTAGLVKAGPGAMTLSANNTYNGTTTVNGGKLEVTGSLSGTTAVTVNTGGSLLLNSATGAGNTIGSGNVVPDTSANNHGAIASGTTTGAATFTSGGGTLAVEGGTLGSSGNGTASSFGAMTLTGTNVIDFSSGSAGNTNVNLFFNSLTSTAGFTLQVKNYNGSDFSSQLGQGALAADTGNFNDGTNRLIFTTEPGFGLGNYIAGINFDGFGAGATEVKFGSGFEIVPVPEPATTALIGSIALCALIGYRERRRFIKRSL